MENLKSYYFRRAKEETKKILKRRHGRTTDYNWPRTRRVLNKTKLLADTVAGCGVEINIENLMLSILGHTLVQLHSVDKINFTSDDVKKFEVILNDNKYPEKKIRKILQIISEYSPEMIKPPKTFETKLLWIAEKWDEFGTDGVRRAIAYGKRRKMSDIEIIRWYREKTEKIKPMFLDLVKEIPGSEITLKDLRYSLKFAEEFEKNYSEQAV